MPEQQNKIALIWDFDKTLIPEYMQAPLFDKYGIDQKVFWDEVNSIPVKLEKSGYRVNKEIYYLNHILTYIKQDRLNGLDNKTLKELGKKIDFFPGVLDFFPKIKEIIEKNAEFSSFDIEIEHYIISTGLAEMIKGSDIAPFVCDIWGCEYLEEPDSEGKKTLSQIIYSIDNTTKTKAIFEINKGVNKHPEYINVNSLLSEEERRIPFCNMIYIADGPSDIPVFSVVKRNGGLTYAVYKQGDEKSFEQADNLRVDGRIHMYGPANFEEDSQTSNWLILQVKNIAKRIVESKKSIYTKAGSRIPAHIVDEISNNN
ncbi:haloacid dehalogenase-like hydrolase [Plasticicumulans acidivorans]|uniref:Haloacid dehalogenase-like hydrolase n=1 Tax=Plasticicumulans acidivorans TaxID=886464 RepID=A0A317N0I6_9GAMM|nr:haloacid dehalogenase-like hydrolase [Plasticicumulans acidivorans]PWV65650.1 hypothetical protein C7443_101134 [Plasticicumulans acidivorans]